MSDIIYGQDGWAYRKFPAFTGVYTEDELEELVETAKNLMAGRDVKWLRANDATAELVHETLSTIGAQLDTLLVDAPTRVITFEEDE